MMDKLPYTVNNILVVLFKVYSISSDMYHEEDEDEDGEILLCCNISTPYQEQHKV